MSDVVDVYRTATFDSSGRAVIVVGPDRAREWWKVTGYTAKTNSTVQTTLTVYKGSEQAGSRIDVTRKGNDDSSDTQVEIPPSGYPLRFVWSGGSVGALAEISVQGTKVFR